MGIFNKKKDKEDTNKKSADINADAADKKEKLEADAAFYIEDVFRLNEEQKDGAVVAGLMAKGVFHKGDKVYQIDDKGKITLCCVVSGMERPVNAVMTQMDEAAYDPGSIDLSRFGIHLKGVTFDQLKKSSYLLHFKENDNIEIGDDAIADEKEKEAKAAAGTDSAADGADAGKASGKDAVSDKRKDEIGPMVLAENINEDQLDDITIQELCFLICTAEHFNKVKAVANYEDKKKLLYKALYKKLLGADELYITIDRTTNMPFINNDTVDVYSKKSFAIDAANHYLKEYRDLMVVGIPKGKSGLPDGLGLFAWFYYLGAENIVIDNGQYKVAVNRNDILSKPDYSKATYVETPVENPKLRFAINRCLSEARWPVEYEEREKVFAEKNETMVEGILKAKFLVAMKIDGDTEKKDRNVEVIKKDSNIMIPQITNKQGENFQAAFTDWTEFGKVYDKTKWSGLIVDANEVFMFAKDNGIVINPLGENLIISGAVKDEIAKRLKK